MKPESDQVSVPLVGGAGGHSVHLAAPQSSRTSVEDGVNAPLAEGSGEEWDFWEAVGLHCAGYSAETDAHLIAVFMETGKEPHWHEAIARRLGLPTCYVTLLMEILSSAGFCEYGSSPRGAWAVHTDYEANVAKLRGWFKRRWNEDWDPARTFFALLAKEAK